jgi:hypothetical protein
VLLAVGLLRVAGVEGPELVGDAAAARLLEFVVEVLGVCCCVGVCVCVVVGGSSEI